MICFNVPRPCEIACPWSDLRSGGRCACPDPRVEVEVDELSAGEVALFAFAGTAAQRAELAAYLAP